MQLSVVVSSDVKRVDETTASQIQFGESSINSLLSCQSQFRGERNLVSEAHNSYFFVSSDLFISKLVVSVKLQAVQFLPFSLGLKLVHFGLVTEIGQVHLSGGENNYGSRTFASHDHLVKHFGVQMALSQDASCGNHIESTLEVVWELFWDSQKQLSQLFVSFTSILLCSDVIHTFRSIAPHNALKSSLLHDLSDQPSSAPHIENLAFSSFVLRDVLGSQLQAFHVVIIPSSQIYLIVLGGHFIVMLLDIILGETSVLQHFSFDLICDFSRVSLHIFLNC